MKNDQALAVSTKRHCHKEGRGEMTHSGKPYLCHQGEINQEICYLRTWACSSSMYFCLHNNTSEPSPVPMHMSSIMLVQYFQGFRTQRWQSCTPRTRCLPCSPSAGTRHAEEWLPFTWRSRKQQGEQINDTGFSVHWATQSLAAQSEQGKHIPNTGLLKREWKRTSVHENLGNMEINWNISRRSSIKRWWAEDDGIRTPKPVENNTGDLRLAEKSCPSETFCTHIHTHIYTLKQQRTSTPVLKGGSWLQLPTSG